MCPLSSVWGLDPMDLWYVDDPGSDGPRPIADLTPLLPRSAKHLESLEAILLNPRPTSLTSHSGKTCFLKTARAPAGAHTGFADHISGVPDGPAPVPPPPLPKPDCSLNGELVNGQCQCDSGWTGSECGELKFKPVLRLTSEPPCCLRLTRIYYVAQPSTAPSGYTVVLAGDALPRDTLVGGISAGLRHGAQTHELGR